MKAGGTMYETKLLPADVYIVINKTILTDVDRKNLMNLYEPIIGPLATSLYLILWGDLDKSETMSIPFTHHHLTTLLKSKIDDVLKAREALEAVGLLKSYLKITSINEYVYLLYSPLSANDFFAHPIFNIVLYNNVGKKEYESIKSEYKKMKIDLKDYQDVTKQLSKTFKIVNKDLMDLENDSIVKRETVDVVVDKIDFDVLQNTLPKGFIIEKYMTKKTKELINNLAYIYNIDTLKMAEIIRITIEESGSLDKDELRNMTRKYYQYNNSGSLPTLIYRVQPEYLKEPSGDTSKRGKIIAMFENTSPYDFLKNKYHGSAPTSRDLRLLESLLIDLELKPAVVNVLIDYVLRSNNKKLTKAFVETIAGQWKRMGISTAKEAMELAEKEHKKYKNKVDSKNEKEIKTPVWFNETSEKEEISKEEEEELAELLKEFR